MFSDILGTIWRPYSFVVRRAPPILPWALVDLLPQVKFTFFSEFGWILYYWPSGVIRNGSPVWSYKRWTIYRTKWAEWAATGLVWMPKALKYIILIQFWSWMNPLLLALWVKRNGFPVWKWKRWNNFRTKWAEWAACGLVWMSIPSEVRWIPHYWLSGGNKKWLPSIRCKGRIFLEQNGLNRLQ